MAVEAELRQVAHPEPADQEEGHFVPVCQDRRLEPLPPHEGDDAVKESREKKQSSERLRKRPSPEPLSRGDEDQEPELEGRAREDVAGSGVNTEHALPHSLPTQRRRLPNEGRSNGRKY